MDSTADGRDRAKVETFGNSKARWGSSQEVAELETSKGVEFCKPWHEDMQALTKLLRLRRQMSILERSAAIRQPTSYAGTMICQSIGYEASLNVAQEWFINLVARRVSDTTSSLQ